MTTQEKMELWGKVVAAVVSGYAANPSQDIQALTLKDWVSDGAEAASRRDRRGEETKTQGAAAAAAFDRESRLRILVIFRLTWFRIQLRV